MAVVAGVLAIPGRRPEFVNSGGQLLVLVLELDVLRSHDPRKPRSFRPLRLPCACPERHGMFQVRATIDRYWWICTLKLKSGAFWYALWKSTS